MMTKDEELMELAKARGIGEEQFKRIIQNSNDALCRIKKRRIDHRWARNGWTMDRRKTMLSMVEMSVGEYLLLQDRYFPANADEHEKNKAAEELQRRHPEYRTTDKR